MLLVLILLIAPALSRAETTKGECSENAIFPACGQELRPSLQDLAGNATLLSTELSRMTIVSFLNLLTDTKLRQIFLEALQNSIELTASFSLNSLEGNRAKLRRTVLIGLLDLSDQFINIAKHFMNDDTIAIRMSSVLCRLQDMSHSAEEVLRKLDKTSLRTFVAFTTIDASIALMVRCFDPKKFRDGCTLLLDTKKFVIKNVRGTVANFS